MPRHTRVPLDSRLSYILLYTNAQNTQTLTQVTPAMTMTACSLPLPADLERDLNIIGVRRASSLVKAPAADWSFKAPVFDKNGQPEF